MTENVTRIEGFTQVCVWPGTVVGNDVEDFTSWMLNEFGVRVQYLEEILTAPDFENGYPVEGTGGRNDLFFAVHNDDVMKFAVPRLAAGIRWVEDMYGNDYGSLWPKRVKDYCSWGD